MTLRPIAVHTCPLWEEADGHRRIGMEFEPAHPPVVGWVNVLVAELSGERRSFVLTHAASDAD